MHLLHFAVKNHLFADGNKRIAAFLFMDFLHRDGRLLLGVKDVGSTVVIHLEKMELGSLHYLSKVNTLD